MCVYTRSFMIVHVCVYYDCVCERELESFVHVEVLERPVIKLKLKVANKFIMKIKVWEVADPLSKVVEILKRSDYIKT